MDVAVRVTSTNNLNLRTFGNEWLLAVNIVHVLCVFFSDLDVVFKLISIEESALATEGVFSNL